MTEYMYKARDAAGLLRSGTIRAETERDAARQIMAAGLFVLRLRPARTKWHFWRRTDRRFPVLLCRQLAVMLSAGLTIGEALRVLSEQEAGSACGEITAKLYRDVADGERLSEAMAREPQIFNSTIAALVDAGERSGSLDVLLVKLADTLETAYATREKLLTLMLYPCVLALAVLFAAVFLMTFVFPVFVSLLQSLSLELPLPTRLLLSLYGFCGEWWLWVLAAAVLLALLAARLYRRPTVRVRADGLLLRLPVVGGLLASTERMRIADTLSVLLASGLVVDQAIAISKNVTGNAYLRRAMQKAHSEVQKGAPLFEAFRRDGLFPPMLLELLATGEATGETEAMLAKIASFCRLDTDTRAARLRVLLPPLSLLFLGGAVGFILFSAVLPLLDSTTAFM